MRNGFSGFCPASRRRRRAPGLSQAEFIAASWDVVGRKVNKKRFLSDIDETARESTALPVPTDSAAIAMFRLVIMQMRQLIQHRDAIEAETRRRVGEHEDFQRLRQIPGIGPIHALTSLAEAGDLHRFDHYRQFLKFLRLQPRHASIRLVQRTNQVIQVRQRPASQSLLDGGPGGRAAA